MKEPYFQNIISIIKKNKVSYIAIMMFIFFSIHMYLLSAYVIKDLYFGVDNCFDNYKKYNVAVYIAKGINDGIKDEILDIEGTNDIESANISYGYIETKNGKLDIEVRTLTEKLALPKETEGRLPIKNNEIALLKHWAKFHNCKIGDTISVKGDAYLKEEDFVVTALFESSQFLRKYDFSYGVSKTNGNLISCVAFVNRNALNSNIEDNYIMMKNNSFKGKSVFSKEYENLFENYVGKIEDGLNLLLDKEYFIEKWNEEVGYNFICNFIAILNNIYKTVVPILLIATIGILITSISRIVVKQKEEIGIMKAQGFTNNEIAKIYFIYTLSATIIGVTLAIIVTTFISEGLLIWYMKNVLVINIGFIMFDIKKILFVILAPTIIMFFATFFTIKKIVKKDAIDILTTKRIAKTKTYFYQKALFFRKIPIFVQMIINNFLYDKKSSISILTGIIGSVMLLTIGITINRNAYKGFEYQMNNDICFDRILFFNPFGEARDEIENILKNYNINYALCQYTDLSLKNPKNRTNVFTVFIYDNKEDFSKLFKFNVMNNKTSKYKGLYIQESYKNFFNLKEKGYVKIKKPNGDYIYKRTAQYFYNYLLFTLAAIDKESYEEMFDTETNMQAYVIDSKKIPTNLLLNELKNVDGYLYSFDYKKEIEQGFMTMYNLINAIVGIFIFTSILLSFFVVLNLLKINIIERKTEFVILMINGFTKKEIKKYVFLDVVVMSIIGIIFGLIFGTNMGNFVLNHMANEEAQFYNGINYNAVFMSFIVSAIIYIIIIRFNLKEIDAINMENME